MNSRRERNFLHPVTSIATGMLFLFMELSPLLSLLPNTLVAPSEEYLLPVSLPGKTDLAYTREISLEQTIIRTFSQDVSTPPVFFRCYKQVEPSIRLSPGHFEKEQHPLSGEEHILSIAPKISPPHIS